MKKVFKFLVFFVGFFLFISCNKNDGAKKKNLLGLYFDQISGAKSVDGSAFTKPISEEMALKEIDSFYTRIKPGSQKMKCLIDVSNLSTLLAALKTLGADGIRLYSASYTDAGIAAAPTEIRQLLNVDDYHLIIVPLRKDGTEIKTDGKGNSVIYNYNNDCPHNCPSNWNNASLIGANRRSACN